MQGAGNVQGESRQRTHSGPQSATGGASTSQASGGRQAPGTRTRGTAGRCCVPMPELMGESIMPGLSTIMTSCVARPVRTLRLTWLMRFEPKWRRPVKPRSGSPTSCRYTEQTDRPGTVGWRVTAPGQGGARRGGRGGAVRGRGRGEQSKRSYRGAVLVKINFARDDDSERVVSGRHPGLLDGPADDVVDERALAAASGPSRAGAETKRQRRHATETGGGVRRPPPRRGGVQGVRHANKRRHAGQGRARHLEWLPRRKTSGMGVSWSEYFSSGPISREFIVISTSLWRF